MTGFQAFVDAIQRAAIAELSDPKILFFHRPQDDVVRRLVALRDDARDAVQALSMLGVKSMVLSGDLPPAVQRVVALCRSRHIPLSTAATSVGTLVTKVVRALCQQGLWVDGRYIGR